MVKVSESHLGNLGYGFEFHRHLCCVVCTMAVKIAAVLHLHVIVSEMEEGVHHMDGVFFCFSSNTNCFISNNNKRSK